MSEKLEHATSHEHGPETLDASAEARRNLERIHKEAEKVPRKNLEHLRHQAKERAVSGQETTAFSEKDTAPSPMGVQKALKSASYKQTLRRIQTKLSDPDKVLSRVVHQPAVEKLSNIGAQTIARPSGILGGGFIALVGSAVLLYLARHYGFEYNFTAFFLLFMAGFLAGIILEGFLKLVRRRKNNS